MNYYRQFNKAVVGMTLPGLLAVGGFNLAIDPYGAIASPEWAGNELKIEQFNQVRLFKASAIARVKPQTILLGSSRTDLGLDPNHPALAANPPAYNLGLVGPNMYEVKRYFDHALANQSDLKTVVVGLDFFMFNANKINAPDFNESRLERQNLSLNSLLNISLSLGATEASLRTLKASLTSSANFLYDRNGLRYIHNNEPQRPIPEEFEKMIAGFWEDPGYYGSYQRSPQFIEDLKELVEIARQRNIEVKLFISPSHATQWEALRLAGWWQEFEDWKRELVKIAPVWDFSGYNSITTEAIAEEMNYYWDSSHYRENLGDLILNRLFDYRPETVPADFGVLLTSENVESHLEKIRRDRQTWAQQHPETVKFVQVLKQIESPD